MKPLLPVAVALTLALGGVARAAQPQSAADAANTADAASTQSSQSANEAAGLPDLKAINRPAAEVTSKVDINVPRTQSFYERSPNGTTITAVGQAPIIDAQGNSWSLVNGPASRGVEIAVNGVVDTPTGDVVLLESLNGAVVQENSAGNWYSETTNNDSWVQLPGNPNQTTTPPPPPAAPTPSANGTTAAITMRRVG